MIDPGEDCDDGNTTPGDGCDASCHSELIPGLSIGFGSRDCFQEWLAPPVRARDAHGRPSRRLHCTEGDPTCDHGGAGDETCTFQIALCFNVNDTRALAGVDMPLCTPTNVQRVAFDVHDVVPDKRGIEDFHELNRQVLELAVTGLGAGTLGECIRGEHRDTDTPRKFCSTDAECDTAPGAGDGACGNTALTFDPPLTGQHCTQLVDVEVPLKLTATTVRRGIEVVTVRTDPADDPVSHLSLPGDTDMFRLYCDPP